MGQCVCLLSERLSGTMCVSAERETEGDNVCVC